MEKKKKNYFVLVFGKNKIGENHSGEEEEGLDFCFVNPRPLSLLCTSLLPLACCVPGIRFQPVHPT
jgi:hypothetical protein